MRKDLNQSFIANGATPSGVHFFGSDEEPHALIVETGEVLSLSPELARVAQGAQRLGDEQRTISLLLKHQSTRHPRVQAPKSVPLKALSLAIAQQCNLACTYCYAQHGTFGTDARAMSLKVAMAAVDLLFKDANPGDQRTLAFMGGEPLTNRSALLATVRYALEHASLIGIQVGFSLTTNGTLISDDDIKLFDSLGFTVTIGLDGIGSLNDNQRPFAGGRGSYQRVIQRIKPLLDKPNRRARVYVRATITPSTLDLSETLKTLTALGFDGVMFSPLISTPFATEEMCQKDLIAFLTELKTCGAAFEQSLAEETVIPFTNVLTQLRRIHKRHREDYHCGAGGG